MPQSMIPWIVKKISQIPILHFLYIGGLRIFVSFIHFVQNLQNLASNIYWNGHQDYIRIKLGLLDSNEAPQTRPWGYKTISMLNSAEHKIWNTHKGKEISRNTAFSGLDKPRMSFFLIINVTMPTILGILTFMTRKNFMLSWDEYGKSFITSGPAKSGCH